MGGEKIGARQRFLQLIQSCNVLSLITLKKYKYCMLGADCAIKTVNNVFNLVIHFWLPIGTYQRVRMMTHKVS